MATIQAKLKSLRECRDDGRGVYLRYRQRQVHALYNAVLSNEHLFVQAIREDTGKAEFEAQLEVTLVLKDLQLQFDTSDFKASLDRAKILRKSGRIPAPYGAAFVLGHATAPLDTVLCPLAAAMAAGNVALALFPEPAKATFRLYSTLLLPKIDASAYPAALADADTLETALAQAFNVYAGVTVDENTREKIAHAALRAGSPYHLFPSRGQNVCLISKTAPRSDLARIAALCIRSKFCAMGGQSLGSPSFYCVHEELHNDLVRLLTQTAKDLLVSSDDISQPRWSSAFDTSRFLEPGSSSSMAKIVFERTLHNDKTAFRIYERVSPTAAALDHVNDSASIVLVPFTSTEEALQIIGKRMGHVLSVFANTEEMDYFAAQLRPPCLIANDLPLAMITGICSKPEDNGVRWQAASFERSIRVHEREETASDILPPYSGWQVEKMKKLILPSAVQKVLTSKKHSNIIRRVFFLQGLFLSLSLVLGSTLFVGGFGALRLYRYFKVV